MAFSFKIMECLKLIIFNNGDDDAQRLILKTSRGRELGFRADSATQRFVLDVAIGDGDPIYSASVERYALYQKFELDRADRVPRSLLAKKIKVALDVHNSRMVSSAGFQAGGYVVVQIGMAREMLNFAQSLWHEGVILRIVNRAQQGSLRGP